MMDLFMGKYSTFVSFYKGLVDLYTLNVSNDDISPKIQSNFSALKRTHNLQAGPFLSLTPPSPPVDVLA